MKKKSHVGTYLPIHLLFNVPTYISIFTELVENIEKRQISSIFFNQVFYLFIFK